MSYPKFVHDLRSTHLNLTNLTLSGDCLFKGVKVESPKSGDIVDIGTQGLIVAPSGSLSKLTIAMPSSAQDGQVLYLSFTQDVELCEFLSLIQFSNKSLLGPVIKAGDCITLMYNKERNKWFKLCGCSSKE